MLARSLWRAGILAVLIVTLQGTWTLAGTTGAINGTVSLSDGTPVADAHITAASPSQTVRAVTTAQGHYAMLSLQPDTYTVTATKEGYESVQQAGITVTADQTQTVNLHTQKAVTTLGRVTVLGTSSPLVSRGQVANVYAVNAQTLQAVQSLGGGNNLENAYSAIDSVPGVFHAIGNAGWGQTLFIHGGNYTEVGYEYDGVPVNRAFDQYNGDTLSSLGNQQVQVYTGGAPASSASSTVSGFINQVIKTGTYPGFATVSLAMGSPSLWNGEKLEIGGATPDRRFTYYAANGNYSDGLRYYDPFNGGQAAGVITVPSVYRTTTFYSAGTIPYCNPDGSSPTAGTRIDAGCYVQGVPLATGVVTPGQTLDHETVVNLHFGVPHPHDGTSDDIQALYSNSYLLDRFYGSTNDNGGQRFVDLLTGFSGAPTYTDGVTWPDGTQFGQTVSFVPGGGACQICGAPNNSNLPVNTYLFPSSPTNRAPFGAISPLNRDGVGVNDAITKLQYTHAMGPNAYLRAYVYTLYSDWLQNGPQTTIWSFQQFGQLSTGVVAPDYELSSHTHGGELQFSDQINDHNLITATGNIVTSKTLRYNNHEMLNGPGSAATSLVDANGNCYSGATGAQTFCYDAAATGSFGDPTQGGTPIIGAAASAGAQWKVTFLGPTGTYNTVKPTFSSYSLSDQIRAGDRWLFNVGLRYDKFHYELANSTSTDNNFWFKAAQQTFCYDPATGQPVTLPLGPNQAPPAAPFEGLNCPASAVTGQPTVHPDGQSGHLLFTNQISGPIDRQETLPRFGGTYTAGENTVIRFNYGRYAQPFETAFTEYLYAPGAGRAAASFNFVNFWGFGYTTPRHDLTPVLSNNYDFSLEQRLPKSNISMRLTPFLRSSQGEYGTLLIGPNFASGYPYANESVQGAEFQIESGNPTLEGWSGQISATYTHASVKLLSNPQGQNGVDFLNSLIDSYNALTAQGNAKGLKGSPCYNVLDPGGIAGPGECIVSGNTITLGPAHTMRTVVNPYYFSPSQPDLDRNGSYAPYQAFPSNFFGATPFSTNLWPWQFSGFVSYKKNKIAISPTFVIQSGNQYGGPTYILGEDPRTCTRNQEWAGITTGNPGSPDFVRCGPSLATNGLLSIPNPATGKFDSPGQYQEPWVFNLNAQISADISPRVTARLIAANVYNTCFGGSKTSWSTQFPPSKLVCGYLPNSIYVSNFYNGSSANDTRANAAPPIPINATPYSPVANPFNPFQMTFQLQMKI
jgi:hypothetical protein